MPLRVIEVVAPRADKDAVIESLEKHRPDEGYVFWVLPLDDDAAVSFRIVLRVQESENVLDKLENLFSWSDKYRIVIYPVEATIPRLQEIEPEEPEPEENGAESEPEEEEETPKIYNRISREELYTAVMDSSSMSGSYLVLVALAAVVAIIGLTRDSVAVIIGAMVLAPLLGPNVGLALASTLGDKDLAGRSLKTLFAGVAVVLGLSVLAGFVFGAPLESREMLLRLHTSYADIVLAVVSGTAGIVSVTLGAPTALVGVMVALSLLPPLTASGLSLGAGQAGMALGAGLLFLTNVICLNLAGVVTFLVQGIQPLTWWERKRARSMTRRVAALWGTLLAVLCLLLYFRIVS